MGDQGDEAEWAEAFGNVSDGVGRVWAPHLLIGELCPVAGKEEFPLSEGGLMRPPQIKRSALHIHQPENVV